MSSHTQNSSTQTTVDGSQANFETALRIATVIVEANQRLFKLQSEAANAAFAENSKHLMSSLGTQDSGALLGEWAKLYETNTRRVLDVTRSCFEIMPQTQAEIAKLMGGPFASANKDPAIPRPVHPGNWQRSATRPRPALRCRSSLLKPSQR